MSRPEVHNPLDRYLAPFRREEGGTLDVLKADCLPDATDPDFDGMTEDELIFAIDLFPGDDDDPDDDEDLDDDLLGEASGDEGFDSDEEEDEFEDIEELGDDDDDFVDGDDDLGDDEAD